MAFLGKILKNKTNKIKVLRVVSRLNIGGPSIHISLLCQNLDSKRFETTLVTGSISSEEGDMSYLINGVKTFSFYKINELQREINPVSDLISLIKLIRIILRERPDIVHSHMAKAGALARVAVKIVNFSSCQNIKLVHTYHGHVLEGYFGRSKSKLFTFIEKTLGRCTDAIVAISKTQKWELLEKYEISLPQKVHKINLGFDLSKFHNGNKQRGHIRNRIGVHENSFLIGIVGRLVPIKNHVMFIDAAKIVINKNLPVRLKFIIVGDGELRQYLEDYAKKQGVADSLYFYGWEKDIQKVYADLDVLALTSLNEGTPVSIIEAMASAAPVVTTGVGGVKDLLGDFLPIHNLKEGFKVCERGILCQTNNAAAFANGLEYVINSGYDSDCKKVSKAREYVLENYSASQLVYNIESLYNYLME